MCWALGAAVLPSVSRRTILATCIAASSSTCSPPIPGAALRAASGYPIEKRLKSLKMAVTVFAPHDDIIEQTQRVKLLLKADDAYLDLPDLGPDLFHVDAERMAELIERHLPP